MAIKMRVLYNSGKKGMAQFANAVKEKYDLPVNAVSGKFPPEYPCDKERIVILAISAKSEMPDDLRRFCGGLNKTQAQNVALLVDGSTDALGAMTGKLGNIPGVKVQDCGGNPRRRNQSGRREGHHAGRFPVYRRHAGRQPEGRTVGLG